MHNIRVPENVAILTDALSSELVGLQDGHLTCLFLHGRQRLSSGHQTTLHTWQMLWPPQLLAIQKALDLFAYLRCSGRLSCLLFRERLTCLLTSQEMPIIRVPDDFPNMTDALFAPDYDDPGDRRVHVREGSFRWERDWDQKVMVFI